MDETILELTDSTNQQISGCNSLSKDEEYCYNEEIADIRYLVPFKSMEKRYKCMKINLINTKKPENPEKPRKIPNDPFELPIIVVIFSELPKFTENSNPQKFLFYLLII